MCNLYITLFACALCTTVTMIWKKKSTNNTGGETCFEWVPALLCFPLPAQGQWFKGCNAVKLLLNVQRVAQAALWKTPVPLLCSVRSMLVPAFMLLPRFGAFLLPRSCQMPEAFPETTWGIRVLGYGKHCYSVCKYYRPDWSKLWLSSENLRVWLRDHAMNQFQANENKLSTRTLPQMLRGKMCFCLQM